MAHNEEVLVGESQPKESLRAAILFSLFSAQPEIYLTSRFQRRI
jgi:hypothetical protein